MRLVTLTCINHPDLRWQSKELAVDTIGRYNGRRGLFFCGSKTVRHDPRYPPEYFIRECTCSAADLRFAPEEIERQKSEPLMDSLARAKFE
jgi:hypothetical protein